MAETLRAGPVEIPVSEIEIRTSRSSGPGGQHANVTESRVEAVFDVAASSALSQDQKRRLMAHCGARVSAVAQDARSQSRNRALALERLAGRIAAGLKVRKQRRATAPSRSARERRLNQKKRRSDVKRHRRRPSGDD